jgi:folylpolyglutamate synthase
MPWVKSVSPSELRQAIAELAPGVATWAPDDVDSGEDKLSNALTWAATKHEEETEGGSEGLIVVAGSLYLVADLYRFMDHQ